MTNSNNPASTGTALLCLQSANDGDKRPAILSPLVTGQCAEVLSLIRKHGPILSLDLTANHAIPETAARVHDLRAKGFNIITEIVPVVVFRGRERQKVARYSLGCPEWPSPDYLAEHGGQAI